LASKVIIVSAAATKKKHDLKPDKCALRVALCSLKHIGLNAVPSFICMFPQSLIRSLAFEEVVDVLVDSGDGWAEVATSQGLRGLVPRNYLATLATDADHAAAGAPSPAMEPAPAQVANAQAVADFAATESWQAR
jgi:hypothetical protein